MIIQCTNCLAKFKFNEEKLKDGQSKKVRCSKCQQVFTVVSPEALKERAKKFELTKAKATASRTPTGQMDGLNGNKKSKPDFAALNIPVKKKSRDDLKGGQAFTSKTADELSGVFGSLSNESNKSGKNKAVKLKPSDLAPQTNNDLGEVHHATPAELSNMDFDSGVTGDKPDLKEQKSINKEIYQEEKKKLGKPEYSKEFLLLKEVSFDSEDGNHALLSVEDKRIGDDPGKLKKLKLEFKPQPLTGSQVEDYKGWSPFSKFMISTVRILLIMMILVTILVGSMMIYKGDNFNIYTLGLDGNPLDVLDVDISE